jgi:hypothetical protein
VEFRPIPAPAGSLLAIDAFAASSLRLHKQAREQLLAPPPPIPAALYSGHRFIAREPTHRRIGTRAQDVIFGVSPHYGLLPNNCVCQW